MYSALFSLLRRLDPEWTHEAGMAVIRTAGLPGLRSLVGGWQPSAQSETTVMGLSFRTPFGLAAGFDNASKNSPTSQANVFLIQRLVRRVAML